MVIKNKLYTMEEFEAYIAQPENADCLFELINGEIIEVSPGRTSNSEFGLLIAAAVVLFCRNAQIACHVSGSDGAYKIGNNTVAPDFAYKRTAMSDEYPDPEPPLWVVEIISPTDKAPDIRDKRRIYLQAGILLWELYAPSKSIDVYAPGQPLREVGIDDILDVGDLIPGFKLAVKEFFGE
jgi:Uma2 family endonuclease